MKLKKIAENNTRLKEELATQNEIAASEKITQDSLAQKQLDSINQILSTSNGSLKKTTLRLKKSNDKKDYLLLLLYSVSFCLVISLVVIAYLFKKDKKHLKQKISLINLTRHDCRRLIKNIPLIWKRIEKTDSVSISIKNAIAHTKNVAGYVKTIFELGPEPTSPISGQIELAKIYSETFKETSLPEDYVINIINNIDDKYILEKLPVPTLLLNNFIKNSIEHGILDEKETILNVTIDSLSTSEGYTIYIEDDGCGINTAKKNEGTPGKGMQFVREAIDVYNDDNKQFQIEFSGNSVFDKEDKNMGRGTVVVLKFIKK